MNEAEKKLRDMYFMLRARKEDLKRTIQDSQAKITVVEDMLTEVETSLSKVGVQHVYEGFHKEESTNEVS